MIESQIANLIFGLSFSHNLCFNYSNGSCDPILNIYVPRISHDIRNFSIQWVFTLTIVLWIFESPLGLQLSKWELTWECRVHSLTHSYTPGNMKCDSQTSFLARTFASPCLGREPYDRVATYNMSPFQISSSTTKKFNCYPKINKFGWQVKPIYNCHPMIDISQIGDWHPFLVAIRKATKTFFLLHMTTFFLYWQLHFKLPSIVKCKAWWKVSKDILHAPFFHQWLNFSSIAENNLGKENFFSSH